MADKLIQNYVNGRLVDSAATEFTELVDPATGKVIGRSPKSTPQEVDEAVQAAAAAFEEWKRTTPSQRQQACSSWPTPSRSTPTCWWSCRAATPARSRP